MNKPSEVQEEKKEHVHNNELPLPYKLLNRMELRIALKAGVAATLSLYLGVGFARLLDRPDSLISGTWCVLSTFVVLQAHLGGTYRAAWVRLLGVLVGSFMGGLFTSIFGSNALTLGISVVITVAICSIFQLKDSIRIACLSLSVVMVLWGLHPSISPWKFGLFRFLDSALGILIAVVVSHVLWPEQATRMMRLSIAKTLHSIDRLFQLELELKAPPKNFERTYNKSLKTINARLDETKQFLSDSELELLTKSTSLEEWKVIIDHLEHLFESTIEMAKFQEYQINKILDPQLRDCLNLTLEACDRMYKDLGDMLKTSKVKERRTDLRSIVEELDEDLSRFRKTRTTRKYERREVEQFFVFFYHLRTLIDEQLHMEEKIIELNLKPI